MDIQASKLVLVRLIINIDNKKIIDKVLTILKSEKEDFWPARHNLSIGNSVNRSGGLELSTEEKEEIELGIKQLDDGQRISWDDFQKKVS